MTDRDRKAFAEAMHALGETFNEPVSDVRAEAYFDALSDFPIERVNSVVRVALRTCRFFPKPVELREMLDGTIDERADRAWGELMAQIRRVGYMGCPTFDDDRVMDVVRQLWGGWRRLCETLPGEGPELVGWIKQFKAVYGSVASREEISRATINALPDGLRQQVAKLAATKVMP